MFPKDSCMSCEMVIWFLSKLWPVSSPQQFTSQHCLIAWLVIICEVEAWISFTRYHQPQLMEIYHKIVRLQQTCKRWLTSPQLLWLPPYIKSRSSCSFWNTVSEYCIHSEKAFEAAFADCCSCIDWIKESMPHQKLLTGLHFKSTVYSTEVFTEISTIALLTAVQCVQRRRAGAGLGAGCEATCGSVFIISEGGGRRLEGGWRWSWYSWSVYTALCAHWGTWRRAEAGETSWEQCHGAAAVNILISGSSHSADTFRAFQHPARMFCQTETGVFPFPPAVTCSKNPIVAALTF